MGSFLRSMAGVLVVLLLAAPLCAAPIPLLTSPGPITTVTNPQGGSYGLDRVLGYTFTVGTQPLDVTALGMWDYEQNGIPAAMHIALWDNASDALLADVVVPQGTAARLEGQFRYVDLASLVRLDVGKTYTLGFRKTLASSAGLVQSMRTETAVVSPAIAAVAGTFRTEPIYLPGAQVAGPLDPAYAQASLSAQRPTQWVGGGPIVGPNLLFNVVPEPATAGVVACGALVMLRRRARP